MKPSCPVCSGVASDSLRAHTASFNQEQYTLHECSCGLQFWYPLKIIPEFYEESDHESYTDRHQGKSVILERHLTFLKRFRGKANGLRLLDLGCADGSFLKAAQRLGFEVWGLDLDSKSIDAAQERGLVNVYNLTLPDFAKLHTQTRFDVITAFEVLEHQDDPCQFVNDLRVLLTEGGVFAGSVPNRDRPIAERTRKTSDGDFPPHHFLWFSRDVLKSFLLKQGFETVRVDPLHMSFDEMAAYLEYNLLGGLTTRLKSRIRANNQTNTAESRGERVSGGGSVRGGILRRARTMVFLPISIALRRLESGVGLYFECIEKRLE